MLPEYFSHINTISHADSSPLPQKLRPFSLPAKNSILSLTSGSAAALIHALWHKWFPAM